MDKIKVLFFNGKKSKLIEIDNMMDSIENFIGSNIKFLMEDDFLVYFDFRTKKGKVSKFRGEEIRGNIIVAGFNGKSRTSINDYNFLLLSKELQKVNIHKSKSLN